MHRPPTTLLHIVRQYVYVWIFLAAMLLLLTIPPQFIAAPSCDSSYGIVFDAGSTGSRVHVFDFSDGSGGGRRLRKEIFQEVKPGLSSFENANDAAESLRPLFDIAVQTVPANAQRCTSWALYATAGLRLVGEKKSEEILKAVRVAMGKYPFRLVDPDKYVAVMQGMWEGPYAWATIHFLMGSLGNVGEAREIDPASYSVVLDMGGASTQVVFAVPPSATPNLPKESLVTLTLAGKRYTLFQHSYLGLGLKEAEKRVVRTVKTAAGEGGALNFSCIPVGGTLVLPKTKLSVRNDGKSFGFEGCYEQVVGALIDRRAPCPQPPCAFGGVHQPSLGDTPSRIIAMSYFFDLMHTHLPGRGSEGGDVTVGAFRTAGEEACRPQLIGSEITTTTQCLDYAILFTILHDGYGIPVNRVIRVAKKIDGIETAWPLGAFLAAEGSNTRRP